MRVTEEHFLITQAAVPLGLHEVAQAALRSGKTIAEGSADRAIDHGGIFRHPLRFQRLRLDVTRRTFPGSAPGRLRPPGDVSWVRGRGERLAARTRTSPSSGPAERAPGQETAAGGTVPVTAAAVRSLERYSRAEARERSPTDWGDLAVCVREARLLSLTKHAVGHHRRFRRLVITNGGPHLRPSLWPCPIVTTGPTRRRRREGRRPPRWRHVPRYGNAARTGRVHRP